MVVQDVVVGDSSLSMELPPGRDGSRQFFFDVAEIPLTVPGEGGLSILGEAALGGMAEKTRAAMAEIYGDEYVEPKQILTSPTLSVTWVRVKPGGRVLPHRHDTHQVTYVLSGSLNYGNKVVSAGMGRFGPNTPYAWTAGPEGAEMLEIHNGVPQMHLPPEALQDQ